MRLLLDTHIFLWAVAGSRSLKAPIRRIMEEADQIYVSAASIWEIAIKARLGKIEADAGDLVEAIANS
jgi:PIN domain nuclease of toxin-antitoxin system